MLKHYHKDTEDPDRRKSNRAPVEIRMEFDKEAEEIIADRTYEPFEVEILREVEGIAW